MILRIHLAFAVALISVYSIIAQPIFIEEEGIVRIDLESAEPLGQWVMHNELAGFIGDGYLEFEGPNFFNAPGNSLLAYKIRISTPGTYQFRWHSRITEPNENTDFNDSWLRCPDADLFYAERGGRRVFPQGSGLSPNPEGTSSNNWLKAYQNRKDEWFWGVFTSDNDPHDIYMQFDNAGDYTIEISGRSTGHAIDRFVLVHSSASLSVAEDLTQPESERLTSSVSYTASRPSSVSATSGIPPASTALPTRMMTNLNAGWMYLEDNTADLKQATTAKDWARIDLPHTWNQWDAMDPMPGYRRDASWYQKTISVKGPQDARYHLYFEGSNITTEVYVDGKKAGGHVGGYVGFDVDITDYVTPGTDHTISIRVDNSYNPDIIPSQKADFFIYGGITRDLWMKVLPKTHLADVRVSTPEVTAAAATTSIMVDLGEGAVITTKHTIACTITDAKGRVVAEKQMKVSSLGADKTVVLPAINNPALWSPDAPNLYTAEVKLMDGKNVVDVMTEPIGYRFYHFEPYGAFYLNGERLLLRGTHRHEEHAGYGAAMPNELHVQDMKMMKEMGVNFLRLGHYPQDPEIYRMADELGIVLWDELPWCRGGLGEEVWQANTERLFREQIRQNFNHPSIFFWSVGNEIYWLPGFENGDDEEALNAYVSKLNDIAKEEDPYRLTAIRKYYAGADRIDVFSPSIWSGWYAGVYTNYRATLKKNQKLYKQFLHMEYGGSSHVGRHTENPITGSGSVNEDDWAEVANQVNISNIAKDGDWTESYIVDLFDHHLSVTETEPTFAGNAQWAFKDFGTPLRPQNAIPYMNQKGLVDRDGKRKDAFYVYKSYWGKDPFAYIESHTWTHRRGPEGKARNVPVFSNADEVELVQAGKSLGRKTKVLGELPAQGLNWDVQFRAGANHLEAKAYNGGKLVATDTLTVFYDFQQAGNPDQIHLAYTELENGHLLVEATLRDKDGLRVYDYEEEIYFTLDGQGELLKYYGTPTGSDIIQMANGRAAIELLPEESGRAIIEARNQDFKGSYIVINFNPVRKQ